MPPSSWEDGEGTLITDSAKLDALAASDDIRASYDCGETCTDYEFHRFKFKIDEDAGDIEEIFVLHEGYGIDGHSLYIWNDDTESWHEVASISTTGSDQTLSGVFTAVIADYIDDDGFLNLLAVSLSPHPTNGGTFYTDYVKVEVFTSDYSVDSNWTSSPPNIDGSFQDGEWTDPKILIMEPIHTFVYFFNDNDFLYVCVDAPNTIYGDYTEDDDDYCDLVFDTGNDETWTAGDEDYFQIRGDGYKMHLIATGSPFNWTHHCDFDAHPGLEGSVGFGTSPNAPADNHRIYEFKIPLSLLGASPGDTIGFSSWDSIPYDDNGGSDGKDDIWPPGVLMQDLSTWGDLVLYDMQPEPSPTPHPVGAVGGEAYPVNKVGLIAPWIALGMVIGIGGLYLIRRRVHN